MSETKLQIKNYNQLKFPEPKWVIQKYKELCDYIESVPCGGEGIQGKASTLYSHRKWLYESELHDGSDSELKEWLLHLFFYPGMVPREISKILDEDVGLRTLNLILCGVDIFYLCDDCRAPLFKDLDPLITDDEDDGCPWCGDCFNDRTDYKFLVGTKQSQTSKELRRRTA